MPECSKRMTFVNIVNNRDFNVFIFQWKRITNIFGQKIEIHRIKWLFEIWNHFGFNVFPTDWFQIYVVLMWFWYGLPLFLAHPIWLKKSWLFSWFLYHFWLYELIVYYCALLVIRSIWSYSRSHSWFGCVDFIVWPQLTENKISNQCIGCDLLATLWYRMMKIFMLWHVQLRFNIELNIQYWFNHIHIFRYPLTTHAASHST